MRIWVDLTNSPHALLFAPIVRHLTDGGDEVMVTVRQFAHTVELAAGRFENPIVVGRGSRKSISGKAQTLRERVLALRRVASEFRPDVAVSHGSYDQVIAARSLKIPSLVAMDYEYQPANHISFRLATRLLLPEAFEQRDVDRHGGRGKAWRYQGLKEETYLSEFVPSLEIRSILGLDDQSSTVVTLRPPPHGALYHRDENPLYGQLLAKLRRSEGITTLILPRHPAQVDQLVHRVEGGGVRIVRSVVDGPNLIWWSDAVISAGGTMNREAVALGTPAWSLFAGRMGSVDRQLLRTGKLRALRSGDDLDGFKPVPRRRREKPDLDRSVLEEFAARIHDTITAR